MRTIQQELDDLADDFDVLDDWESQLSHVIDLGKGLPPLRLDEQVDANKVRGCSAQVWLVTEKPGDGTLRFRGDSDAPMVRGLVAVLLKLVSGHPAAEIARFDLRQAFSRLGLLSHLSLTRANGLASMAAKIHNEAEFALKQPGFR